MYLWMKRELKALRTPKSENMKWVVGDEDILSSLKIKLNIGSRMQLFSFGCCAIF